MARCTQALHHKPAAALSKAWQTVLLAQIVDVHAAQHRHSQCSVICMQQSKSSVRSFVVGCIRAIHTGQRCTLALVLGCARLFLSPALRRFLVASHYACMHGAIAADMA